MPGLVLNITIRTIIHSILAARTIQEAQHNESSHLKRPELSLSETL